MIKTIEQIVDASQIVYSSDSGYTYTYNHSLGTGDYLVEVLDENNNTRNTSCLFRKENDYVQVSFPSNTFNGTWKILVIYEDGTTETNFPKKRLFEQTLVQENEIQNYGDWRLALGVVGQPTYNMTLNQFKTFCQTSLDSSLYLLKSNNLSDVDNVATARQNLNVYSKQEVDNFVDNLYPASGYVDTISAFTSSGTPLDNPVTFIPVKDFSGFQCQMSFNTSLNSSISNRNIGSVTVTSLGGVTLKAEEQYFPIYYWANNVYYNGQLVVTPVQSSNNLVLNFKISLVNTGTYQKSCQIAFHFNIGKN